MGVDPASFDERHPLKGERYWSRETPDGPWDDVVVGSGMGGLTVAALLTELGRRVLVLEQHYVPGGFTHAFAKAGYVWDVGVHAIGEVTRHTVTGRLLDRLTRDRLEWASLGAVYEEFHFPDGMRIDFPDDPARYRENLLAAFPEAEAAIDVWLASVREAARAMRWHYLARTFPPSLASVVDPLLGRRARPWLQRTVDDVLDTITDDPRLRGVLTSQWGYYGTPPSRAPFAIQALITRHFLHGAFYPVGGAQEIARCLTRTISEGGGWTRIVADVDEVLVEGGRATGVRLADGEEIRARRVFLASGLGTAVRRLLPAGLRETDWARSIREIGAGPAHVCLYLGFRGDPRSAGASSANQWFYDTWDQDASMWEIEPGSELSPAPVLYTSYPSLKDPTHDPGPEERHTGEVVTFVPWSCFERWKEDPWQKRGDDYESFKDRIRDRILEQLLRHRPGLEAILDHVEVSTPLSTDTFCRPLQGSIYGFEASRERFANRWLRSRSPVSGLFFAASDIASGGVMGAMGGGLLATISAEPVAAMRWLRGL